MSTTDKTYRARCTHSDCGWVGSPQQTEAAAYRDGDAHSVAIADPENIHDHHWIEVGAGYWAADRRERRGK
jgi:hypothetical protein